MTYDTKIIHIMINCWIVELLFSTGFALLSVCGLFVIDFNYQYFEAGGNFL
jgi:hypothetical protein